jgi:hypothetical protein
MKGRKITYGVATRDVIEKMVASQKDDDELFGMAADLLELGH